jgi:hypothetical protein
MRVQEARPDMGRSKPRPRGTPLRALTRGATDLVETQAQQLAELEVVFELYCELWDLAAHMPAHDGHDFVLEELAESGVSNELRAVLNDFRRLPFVAAGPGMMSDRDRNLFGLQILLNQLLQEGKRLLSPELLPNLESGAPVQFEKQASGADQLSRRR